MKRKKKDKEGLDRWRMILHVQNDLVLTNWFVLVIYGSEQVGQAKSATSPYYAERDSIVDKSYSAISDSN